MDIYNIYLVDDNPTIRMFIKEYLQFNFNCRIIGEAINGEVCLIDEKIFQSDIILMDYQMPIINGLETAKQLLRIQPQLNIIAVSYEKDINIQELIDVGYKGFVSKKNIYTHLIEAIQSVMRKVNYFPESISVKRLTIENT